MIEVTTKVREKATGVFKISFFDELGQAVVPLSATWSLGNIDGTIINSRTAVVITPLASVVYIVISGLDTALIVGDAGERRLLVEWVYNSTAGNNLPGKEEVKFFVENLILVT